MKILLADDQCDVRLGLRVILEQQPGMEVIAEAAGYRELLKVLKNTQADIILLDWELPDINILNISTDIHSKWPDIRVVALSGNPDAKKEAIMSGADAFVCKCDQPEKLIEAIEEVCIKGGEKYASY